MMEQAVNPNHYYRGWGRLIRKKFKAYVASQWVKGKLGKLGKLCLKIKCNKKAELYSSRTLIQCVQGLIPVIKVMKKKTLLLDCLGSCFSFYF